MPTEFSGTGGDGGRRWLIKLSNELRPDLSDKKWIDSAWSLLTDVARKWSNMNAEVKEITRKPNPTSEDRERFAELLDAEYPEPEELAETANELKHQLQTMKQSKDETLKEYYTRILPIFKKAGGKDLSAETSLSEIETMWLSTVVERFVTGIYDQTLQLKVHSKYIDGSTIDVQSLKGALACAEKALKKMESEKLAAQKQQEENRNERLQVLDAAFEAIKAGGPNRTKALKVAHTYLIDKGIQPEAFSTSFTRPARQPSRINSSDRTQELNPSESATANNHGLQQHPGYSPQDSRGQQQGLALVAASAAPSAPASSAYRPRNEVYWKNLSDKQDADFNPQTHSNRFINGSVQYDRILHGICCYGCGECGHMGRECPNHEKLSPPARRHLQKVTGYNSRPRIDEGLTTTTAQTVTAIQPQVQQARMTSNYQQPSVISEPVEGHHSSNITAGQPSHYVGTLSTATTPDFTTRASRFDSVWDPDQESPELGGPVSRSLQIAEAQAQSSESEQEDEYDLFGGASNSNSVKLSSGNEFSKLPFNNNRHPAVREARKRRKPNEDSGDNLDPLQDDEGTVPAANRPKKKGMKQKGKKKVMKPIAGLIGKPELDVSDVMMNQTITLPAMYLYQISPFFRDEVKRLMTAPRKSRKKGTGKADAVATNANVSKVDLTKMNSSKNKIFKWVAKAYYEALNKSPSAFAVPCIVFKTANSERVQVPFGMAKADQGSDLILISDKLANRLKLERHESTLLDESGIKMTVASGHHHELKQWVVLNIDTEGITRQIWAFVNPHKNSTHLLLGLPWLEAVNARIITEEQKIYIGNKELNENVCCVSSKAIATEMLRTVPTKIKSTSKATPSFAPEEEQEDTSDNEYEGESELVDSIDDVSSDESSEESDFQ